MNKKNYTRKDLKNKIYHNLGFSKNMSKKIVDDFFETMVIELVNLQKIKISSFGTFQVKEKNERMGRNPKTKENAKITARKVVTFKASDSFKEKLNKNETTRKRY